jgi:hypothetical protein
VFVVELLVLSMFVEATYCNGPLPFNGELVTDFVSAVTDADIVTAATVMHCDWVEAFQR